MNLIKVSQTVNERIQRKFAGEKTLFLWHDVTDWFYSICQKRNLHPHPKLYKATMTIDRVARWIQQRIWIRLARSRHVSVRCAIARKRCIPESVLSGMLADPDKRVRRIAAHNPATPFDNKRLAVLDEEEEECLGHGISA